MAYHSPGPPEGWGSMLLSVCIGNWHGVDQVSGYGCAGSHEQKAWSWVWPLSLPPSRCGNSSVSGGRTYCLPPSPAPGLPVFPVWQMQSRLIVCGGDPSLWLDPAKTLSVSPTRKGPQCWLPKLFPLKREYGV